MTTPEIAAFQLGYTPTTRDPSVEVGFISLIVRGPLERIDWSDLEVRLDSIYGDRFPANCQKRQHKQLR